MKKFRQVVLWLFEITADDLTATMQKTDKNYINTWSRRDHGPHNPATSAKDSRSRVTWKLKKVCKTTAVQCRAKWLMSLLKSRGRKLTPLIIFQDCLLALVWDTQNYSCSYLADASGVAHLAISPVLWDVFEMLVLPEAS